MVFDVPDIGGVLLQVSQSLHLVNSQAFSGHFEMTVPVFSGDCVTTLVSRMHRNSSLMKGLLGTRLLNWFYLWYKLY